MAERVGIGVPYQRLDTMEQGTVGERKMNKELGIPDTYVHTNTDLFPDLFPDIKFRTLSIEHLRFPHQISKVQYRGQDRKDITGRQMILNPDESQISLELNFVVPTNLADIGIQLKVKRAIETTNCFNDFVELDPSCINYYQNEGELTKVIVSANLSKIKKEDIANDVYKLSRNKDKKKNEFYVTVEVWHRDMITGTESSHQSNTRHFMVLGSGSGSSDSSGVKRRRTDTAEGSPASTDSGFSGVPSPLSSAYSPLSSVHSPHESGVFFDAQKDAIKHFDKIQAEHAHFENLSFNKVIKTGNGDIAYHFVLKDQDQNSDEEYNPGEIIGFTTDEHEGKVVLVKLTAGNANDVFLKGVVTESQYLEANKPKDEKVITATICMLGIVPVQTIGPVYPGDGLFASKDIPGIAMPEDYVADKKSDTPIAFALEKYDCPDDEIHETKALVSILGGAVHEQHKKDMNSLQETLTVNIADNSRKSKKRHFILGIFLGLFSIAVALALYQRYGIGTMLQRHMCRQGSDGHASYFYWLQGHKYRGVRFKDCETVWDKATIDRRFYKRPEHIHVTKKHLKCVNGTKGTEYDYYINLESCTGVLNPGAVYIFAIDKNCTHLYTFDEVKGDWVKDQKVCRLPKCNLQCSHVAKVEDPERNCELEDACT